MHTINVNYRSVDGREVSHDLPAVYQVCPRCEGEGRHVNPNIECDGGGITQREMEEILHEDPEFLENYLGGAYDVTCQECRGKRVVLVVDRASSSDPEHREAYAAFLQQEKEDERFAAEVDGERRMGA